MCTCARAWALPKHNMSVVVKYQFCSTVAAIANMSSGPNLRVHGQPRCAIPSEYAPPSDSHRPSSVRTCALTCVWTCASTRVSAHTCARAGGARMRVLDRRVCTHAMRAVVDACVRLCERPCVLAPVSPGSPLWLCPRVPVMAMAQGPRYSYGPGCPL